MLQKQQKKNENPLCHKSYAYFVLYIYMDMVINHLIGGQDNRHHQTNQPQQPRVVIPTPTAKTTAASEILQMKSMMFQEISRSMCPLCWWTEYCRKIGTIHYELTSVRNSVGDKLRQVESRIELRPPNYTPIVYFILEFISEQIMYFPY